MASNYRLRRFARAGILKQFDWTLLRQFLSPYETFLRGRGCVLPEAAEHFGYDQLARILMSPGEDTPDTLLDALFFVDELADARLCDEIHERAEAAGFDRAGTEDLSLPDLAMRVWLHDPTIVERMHAEQFVTRPKRFDSYSFASSTSQSFVQPVDSVIAAVEAELDDWFEAHKKGRGTRVFPFVRDDGAWFLIRHGERFKREATVGENGESERILYRPEKFDVVIYYRASGELAVHADTKAEREAYCRSLGRHLFGDPNCFDLDAILPKYTLRPLIELGREALRCHDVGGIRLIVLTELQVRHDAEQRQIEIHRGDDVLAAFEQSGRQIPEDAELVLASFRVHFAGAVKPRGVKLRVPNVTVFERESDSEVVHEWMGKRGFLSQHMTVHNARPTAALAVYRSTIEPESRDGRMAGANR